MSDSGVLCAGFGLADQVMQVVGVAKIVEGVGFVPTGTQLGWPGARPANCRFPNGLPGSWGMRQAPALETPGCLLDVGLQAAPHAGIVPNNPGQSKNLRERTAT